VQSLIDVDTIESQAQRLAAFEDPERSLANSRG
jgi:hypothetical protein